jgi:type II secretory pathway predicted ATPase ExeA
MYESHFGMRVAPFALTPDPLFLYRSPKHQYGLALLDYSIEHGPGFCLLTGEIGSGKTLLVQELLTRVDARVRVGLIAHTHRNLGKLLPWVCDAFGLNSDNRSIVDHYRDLLQLLREEQAQRRRLLLIVDEVQNLDAPLLEELRVLSNINAGGRAALQVVLVGQPEIRATLRRPEMRQFVQRIGIEYHLQTLDLGETREYVRHRLQVAGGSPELIDAAAIGAVYEAVGGVPRLINQLCDMALVHSFAGNALRVDRPLMQRVIHERIAGGLLEARGT